MEGDPLSRRELYAWIFTEPDSGVTGIARLTDKEGNSVPLVDLNQRVAEVARPFVIESGEAERRHAPIRLVKFVEVETLDTVMPRV